jgi:hypothetical protein
MQWIGSLGVARSVQTGYVFCATGLGSQSKHSVLSYSRQLNFFQFIATLVET